MLDSPYDEIKSINGFLRKDEAYNHNEKTGTIPFEIFHKWSWNPAPRFPYAGWILALFNPELLIEIKKKNSPMPTGAVTPSTLAFILFDGIEGEEEPFCCIAFENIPDLRRRIMDCLPSEWDLENWNLPDLTNKEYWQRYINFDNHGFSQKWDEGRGGMIQNCWHIPFKSLADLATVTMIGEDKINLSNPDPAQEIIQIERLAYLKEQAIRRTEIDGQTFWREHRIQKNGDCLLNGQVI